METYWKKKYEDALERMKYVVLPPSNDRALQAIKETVFPELAESEDERMKKAIIDALLSHCNSINLLSARGYQIEDVKAWLEKQKETLHISELCKENADSFTSEQKEQKPNIEICPHSTKSKSYLETGYPIEQKLAKKLSKEDYVKKFKALCDTYEIKLPNRAYDIYHLCKDLHKLFGDADIQKPAECIPDSVKFEEGFKTGKELGFREGVESVKEQKSTATINGEPIPTENHSVNIPLPEWSEDWREEDIQTRFAFYTYKDDPSVLYLSNVFVEETSRNHGFGTRILKAAEKVAETIGATTINLKVKQDSPANDWYRKNGYGYVSSEDGYDWLEKNLEYLKPKKEVEWSKEDEEIFNLTITHLLSYTYPNNPIYRKEAEKCIAWLKSIHLRPSWKPSEEQMEALQHAIDACESEWAYQDDELRSLLNELKKLK